VAIDPSLVTVRSMRIDVETRGEYTRGQTVGNRHNMVERNELRGDRYVMVGIDKLEPNSKVAVEVEAERFLTLFVERISGK
jgi:inosine-uridine nucleoside N-ribohydrolase